MSKYPLHDGVLAYARKQIGVHEAPMGSNRGPIVDFYEDHDFLPGHGYPWCVSFVLTCWQEGAGRPLPYKTASAYALLNWARGAGWVRRSTDLIPGDIVVFNVGSGHVGIFERWEGPFIQTIDGNHNNAVGRAVRSHDVVAGGIHVPEKAVLPPAPEPYWVIATSESGHRKLLFSKFATEKTVLGLLPRWFAKYGVNGVTIKRGRERGK